MFKEFLTLALAFTAVVGAGMAFTFGVFIVCKVLKWAPVNLTVNIHNKEADDARTQR